MAQVRRVVPIASVLLTIGALTGVGHAQPGSISACPPSSAGSSDPFSCRWNLEQVRAPSAWTQGTGQNIPLGIVDTGVDATHPSLSRRVVTAVCQPAAPPQTGSTCAVGPESDSTDGHGTAVTGIAAASRNTALGFAGVAPSAIVAVAKVLAPGASDIQGQDLAAGIRWEADQGVRIITVALGDPLFPDTKVEGPGLLDGMQYAATKGAVVVVASTDPANLGIKDFSTVHGLVVGATARTGSVTVMPDRTAKRTIVAPGGTAADEQSGIAVATPVSSYGFKAGVSLAAAHVSGALALLLADHYSPDAAVTQLIATAANRGMCGTNCGFLDVAAAVGVSTGPPKPPGSGGGTGGPATSVPGGTGDNSGLPGGYTLGASPTTTPLNGRVGGAGGDNGTGPGQSSKALAPGTGDATQLHSRHAPGGVNHTKVAGLIALSVLALLGVLYAARGLLRTNAANKNPPNLA